MTEVEFCDSVEEAWERIEQARKAADARVEPWQAAARAGDCFVTVAEGGLVIFGEVPECYDEARMRHYRFCRCYSVACPDGELGDVHVSVIERFISRDEFEEAWQKGWVPCPAGGDQVPGSGPTGPAPPASGSCW